MIAGTEHGAWHSAWRMASGWRIAHSHSTDYACHQRICPLPHAALRSALLPFALCPLPLRFSGPLRFAPLPSALCPLRSGRQLNDKFCALGNIILNADKAVVIGNNRTDNRQSQTHAGLFS